MANGNINLGAVTVGTAGNPASGGMSPTKASNASGRTPAQAAQAKAAADLNKLAGRNITGEVTQAAGAIAQSAQSVQPTSDEQNNQPSNMTPCAELGRVQPMGDGGFYLPDGKYIEVVEPRGSIQWKVALIMPPSLSSNLRLTSLMQAAFYIAKIDGITQTHNNFNEVQAIVDKVGDEGIILVEQEVNNRYPASQGFLDKMRELKNL